MSERKLIRVRDVMRTEFHTVDGMATVQDALQLLKQHHLECLVITSYSIHYTKLYEIRETSRRRHRFSDRRR